MIERKIQAEPADTSTFEPYGEVLDIRDTDPVFQNFGLRSWRTTYQADGATELMVIEFDEIPMTFARLERHHAVSQCFIPLRGRWTVMVVAARSDAEPPRPDTVRAFLFAPHQGILLHRGVWHALNRFPLGGSAVHALLTTSETQAELEAERIGGPAPRRTDVHDFSLEQITFKIEHPPLTALGA